MHTNILLDLIKDNDIEAVEKMISDPLFIHPKNIEYYFSYIIQSNMTDMFNVLFLNKKIELDYSNSYAIREATHYARYDMIKLLLTDSRINPNVARELPIRVAYNKRSENSTSKKHLKTFNVLWSDPRIQESLKQNFPDRYSEITEETMKQKLSSF
jgi:hypothetical protein